MEIFDISRTLRNDLAPWPGDMPFAFQLNAKIGEGSVVNVGSISMSVHSGSHADANFHFDSNGRTIDEAQLRTYFGEAKVVDLTDNFADWDGKRAITVADLESAAPATRLLIKTNLWRDSTVFPKSIPIVASDVPEWFQANGVKLLGLDLPSVDRIDAKVLQNHHALAAARVAIIESLDLTNVEEGVYNFSALPLKIAGADGSPVRAILWRG